MKKTYDELTFTDDFMFCKILQNNEDLCKKLLELLLDIDIGDIVKVDKQVPIEITPDGRGVRFDVYAKDDTGKIYNIEMQNAASDDIRRRSRYYQSVIDVDHAEKGGRYADLPDSYIIFICMFDPFGYGLPKYSFTNRCHEVCNEAIHERREESRLKNGYRAEPLELDDGSHKIFINAEAKYDILQKSKLQPFLEYLKNHQPTDSFTDSIEQRVDAAKSKREWRSDYMTLQEHYEIERAEGRAEGRADVIRNMITKLNISIVQACDIAGISVEEYEALCNIEK